MRRQKEKPGGHGAPKAGDHEIAAVRRMIQDAYLRGELVTIRKLVNRLDEQEISVTPSSLRRALLRNGFFFDSVCRRSALKERDDVTTDRRKYLAALRSDRDRNGLTVRPEIYLDETFVNVDHRKKFTWNEEGTPVNVPSGVGVRLIIIDAIIQDDREDRYGWVKEAHLHFKSGRVQSNNLGF